MIFTILVLFIATNLVQGDLSYTKVSTTYKGLPCINDCVNNKCVIGRSLAKEACSAGCNPAPQYHTTQKRSTKEICLSRCGKFGFSYEWCFTSQDGDWDYCSSNTRTSWDRDRTFTYDYGPCATDCTFYGIKFGPPYYLCDTYWDDRSIDRCNPQSVQSYIESKTIEEDKCVGLCQKEGTDYYWCYDADRNWNYCAPPARPPRLSHFSDKFFARGLTCSANYEQINIPDDFSVITDCSFHGVDQKKSVVSTVATMIEELDSFRTVRLNIPTSSVYSYTVREPQTEEEIIVPLVIKAKFTYRNTKSKNKCVTQGVEDMFENVMLPDDIVNQLIRCDIGGTKEEYNFVPMTDSVKCAFLEYEEKIIHWVQKLGKSAFMTIVVIYNDDILRPIGFGINVTLKYANGSVHEELVDRIICNNGIVSQTLHAHNLTVTTEPLFNGC